MKISELASMLDLDPTGVSEDANGRTVLALTVPVIGEDKEALRSLTFRRAVAGDLYAIEEVKSDQLRAQTILSRVTGQPVSVIASLDVYDFSQASALVTSFFAKSRPTGVKS